MADQVKYRGYVIYLVAEADVWATAKGEKGWRASAVPLSPTLPILPKPSFGSFSSREEASAHCQRYIDDLLDSFI
jgi:hypothetical protein